MTMLCVAMSVGMLCDQFVCCYVGRYVLWPGCVLLCR